MTTSNADIARSLALMMIEWFAGPDPNDAGDLAHAIEKRLNRLLDPAPAVAVPKGLQLVPTKLNAEMIEASANEWTILCCGYPPEKGHAAFISSLWKAMLAAAPQPPATRSYEEGIEAAGAVRFPDGWRERFGGMDLKKQKIWSDGFNACRDAIRSLADDPRHGE